MREKPRPTPIKRFFGFVWWTLVMSLFALGGVVGFMANKSSLIGTFMKNPWAMLNVDPKETFHDYDGLTLLILGTDDDRKMIGWGVDEHGRQHAVSKVVRRGARADMILVAKLDFDRKTITGLSIPRDTEVHLPDRRYRKLVRINGYYSNAPEGEEKATMQRAVEKLLPGVHIDRTIAIDYTAFQDLVNTVGGVPVVVPKGVDGEGLQYDDNAGDLHIHLSPGPKTLDGKDAMGYVRFRHDRESDYGRQERQKAFLASFKSAVFHHPFQLADVAEESKQVMGNALDDQEIIALIAFARRVPSTNIKLGMLPTRETRRNGPLRVVESKRDAALREYNLLSDDRRTAAVEQ